MGGFVVLVVVVEVVAVLAVVREKSGGHESVRGRASGGLVFFQLW